MNPHKQIAKITRAFLGWEDHGILTCFVELDYGGSGQTAGGYALDEYDREKDARVSSAFGTEFIARLMRACGVKEWGQLKSRTVYAIREHAGWNAQVIGIEPLPTEPGERFIFADLQEEVLA